MFLGLFLLLSLPLFSQTVPELKTMINDLLTMNETLEKTLTIRDSQLIDKEKQLTELSTLLVTIKSENQTLSELSQAMQNLSEIRKLLEQESKNRLDQAILERNISLGVNAGLLVWLVIKETVTSLCVKKPSYFYEGYTHVWRNNEGVISIYSIIELLAIVTAHVISKN